MGLSYVFFDSSRFVACECASLVRHFPMPLISGANSLTDKPMSNDTSMDWLAILGSTSSQLVLISNAAANMKAQSSSFFFVLHHFPFLLLFFITNLFAGRPIYTPLVIIDFAAASASKDSLVTWSFPSVSLFLFLQI